MAKRKPPEPKPVDLEQNLKQALDTPHSAPGVTSSAAAASTSGDTAAQPPPPVPGAPCRRAGCQGRYSILHTEKQGRLRIRTLICRTCQHTPDEQHISSL